MPDFQSDFNLKEFNSFGINAKTAFYVEINHESEVERIIISSQEKKTPLVDFRRWQ